MHAPGYPKGWQILPLLIIKFLFTGMKKIHAYGFIQLQGMCLKLFKNLYISISTPYSTQFHFS
jgi:hypothetical protein